MPLFMDRHDLPGTSAEEVAQAHLLDVAASAKHGVQFMSYWFDADNGAAFCLARAPSPNEMQAVHRESHGLVSNEIIRVSEQSLLRFLGRIEDAPDQTLPDNPFRTVMFTDLEGSTSLLHDLGQADYLGLLAEHDLIIRRALVAARGREVKHTGDGFMAAFDDVARALECAVALQQGFQDREAKAPAPLRVRVGLAAGEPVDRDDDLFGSTVNLASRICQTADGGHTLVSELVRDLGAQRGFRFLDAGTHVLKGFPGTTPVYELDRHGAVGSRLGVV